MSFLQGTSLATVVNYFICTDSSGIPIFPSDAELHDALWEHCYELFEERGETLEDFGAVLLPSNHALLGFYDHLLHTNAKDVYA